MGGRGWKLWACIYGKRCTVVLYYCFSNTECFIFVCCCYAEFNLSLCYSISLISNWKELQSFWKPSSSWFEKAICL